MAWRARWCIRRRSMTCEEKSVEKLSLDAGPVNPSLAKPAFTERLRKGDIMVDFLDVIAIV
jgi:hypothetical protein